MSFSITSHEKEEAPCLLAFAEVSGSKHRGQVPVCRYESQDWRINRGFFPEHNITMSALTEATIIVEAGETSGTLIQAQHALKQKRKLFILDSCFENGLEWPAKYAAKGAIRVKEFEEIRAHLNKGGKRTKAKNPA